MDNVIQVMQEAEERKQQAVRLLHQALHLLIGTNGGPAASGTTIEMPAVQRIYPRVKSPRPSYILHFIELMKLEKRPLRIGEATRMMKDKWDDLASMRRESLEKAAHQEKKRKTGSRIVALGKGYYWPTDAGKAPKIK